MTEGSPDNGGKVTRDESPDPKSNPSGPRNDEERPHSPTDNSDAESGDEARSKSAVEENNSDDGQNAEEEEEDDEEENDEEDEEDDDDDEEPKLKYARLTQHLGPLYRNGDATSSFLVAGDKMVGCNAPPWFT